MRALLLNGASKGDTFAENLCAILINQLNTNNYESKLIDLHELEIASCLGCFGCWVKTPGICVIDDAGREVAKAVMQSDLVIYITPVTFGGYSYELKKAIDRLIPIISPFFKKIKGEVHHKPRYHSYPSLVGIGIMSEMDEEKAETFLGLVTSNAINMHYSASASGIVLRSHTPDETVEQTEKILVEVGVKR